MRGRVFWIWGGDKGSWREGDRVEVGFGYLVVCRKKFFFVVFCRFGKFSERLIFDFVVCGFF